MPALGQRGQGAQVDRQPGDRGLGDAARTPPTLRVGGSRHVRTGSFDAEPGRTRRRRHAGPEWTVARRARLGTCERTHKVVTRPLSPDGEPGHGRQRARSRRLVDPPVVVLAAVHQGDRDLLAVLLAQRGVVVGIDSSCQPAPGSSATRCDHLPGVVAQVAARLAEQGDPRLRLARPHACLGPQPHRSGRPAVPWLRWPRRARRARRMHRPAATRPPPRSSTSTTRSCAGASIFHLARGLYRRDFFTLRDIGRLAWQQRGSSRSARTSSTSHEIREPALSFVAGPLGRRARGDRRGGLRRGHGRQDLARHPRPGPAAPGRRASGSGW